VPKDHSQKQTDLVSQTRDRLEFATVLEFFALKAQTNEGRALLLGQDLMTPQVQADHFALLDRWLDCLKANPALRFPAIPAAAAFRRDPLLQPLEREELRDIRDVLTFWERFSAEESFAFARPPVATEAGLPELTRRLQASFAPDGDWSQDVSPRFRQLIGRWLQTEEQLAATLTGLSKRFASYLNETLIYERNHRKVLAVKVDFRGRVKGILHDYSASGHTVYVEPQESVDLQNRLTRIAAEIDEEVWRIRQELTGEILGLTLIETTICPHLAHMDRMQALAITAQQTGCQSLCPNRAHRLDLYQARHPFLDEAFAPHRQQVFGLEEADSNRMVPFSLHLDEERLGLVISGANTGGKTVTLKTTGLLAWMANSGLPVPLDEGSQVPYYTHIFADIGDNQSLSHNLSTFASHLANMRRVLEALEPDTLVLLDELGSGTDPQEGNALARAMIEEIVRRRFHLLVTTHQQVLTTFALTHPHLENGSMIFDARLLKPIYRFTQGVPGRSHALEIAKSAGLPEIVLDEARRLIDEKQVDIQAAIRTLQQQHRDLDKQKQKLRRDELRLHRRIVESRQESDRFVQLQEEFREKTRISMRKTIEAAERQLRALLADVESRKEQRTSVNQFARLRREMMEPYAEPEKLAEVAVETSALQPDQWRAGDHVFLKTFRREAVLLGIDRKKARVECDGKVISTDVGELMHLKQEERPAPAGRVTDAFEGAAEEALPFELHLLGKRVEEAVLEVDQTIDQALRKGLPFLKIIHGHGSGALKSAIRDFLARHLARSCFNVVVDRENDGITEVRFGV